MRGGGERVVSPALYVAAIELFLAGISALLALPGEHAGEPFSRMASADAIRGSEGGRSSLGFSFLSDCAGQIPGISYSDHA